LAKPVNPADEAMPWAGHSPKPRAVAARSGRPVEALHWGVVALTVLTAMSVVMGAYRGQAAAPKELLPIMMIAPRR